MSDLQKRNSNAQNETDKKALKLFLLILIPASLLLQLLYLTLSLPILTLLVMWVPGLAGIIAAKAYYKKEKVLGWKLCPPRYLLGAVLLPLLYLMLSYLAAWGILGDSTAGFSAILENFGSLPLLFLSVGLGIFAAAGEEIGWRGFLYPLLERLTGRKKALLFSGLLWAVWHFPLILGGQYQAETNLFYGLAAFLTEVLLISVILSWSRSASGSVLPAILFHAAHNFFDQSVLQPLSTKPGVPYLAGEQGILTILFTGLLCLVVLWQWRQQDAQSQLEVD